MTSKNAWKFIVITYVIVVLLLLLIAWAVGLRGWGDIFSLGQLLVDAVLLPVVIIGFLMAVEEFRKSQARPDMDLYWEAEPNGTVKELVLEAPPRGNANLHFRPVLLNTGNAVGVWYMLNITLPDELNIGWQPILGDEDNWRLARTKDGLLLTFMSNGQVAAYPNYGLLLCTLCAECSTEREYVGEYKVPYTIVNDWGQRRDDSLTLKLVKSAKNPE
jgi:hypothetical protein